MSHEMNQNERVAREYFSVFNDRNLAALRDILAPDFVSHLRVGELRGIESFNALMGGFYEAFPDAEWIADEWVFTQDRVVLRYHWQGTQQAAFLGIPPTHKTVRGEGLELLHIADGRITEVWNYSDIMGMAAQLSAPAPLDIEI